MRSLFHNHWKSIGFFSAPERRSPTRPRKYTLCRSLFCILSFWTKSFPTQCEWTLRTSPTVCLEEYILGRWGSSSRPPVFCPQVRVSLRRSVGGVLDRFIVLHVSGGFEFRCLKIKSKILQDVFYSPSWGSRVERLFATSSRILATVICHFDNTFIGNILILSDVELISSNEYLSHTLFQQENLRVPK